MASCHTKLAWLDRFYFILNLSSICFLFLLEETFLTGNHLASNGDEENSNDHSFASLTRQIQNQFHLFDKTKNENKSDKNNLFAYLNCKHASI